MSEIVRNLPASAYHAESIGGPIRLSGSVAHKLISRSPLHAWQVHPRLGGRPEEPTDSTDLGTAIHDLILGGGREWAVIDAPDFRTKAAKEARDLALVEGKFPVIRHKADAWTSLAGILKGKLRDAGVDLSETENEISAFWESDGAHCRGRIDAFDSAAGMVTDLKTCKSAEPRAVVSSILSYGYDLKAAAYLEALAECGAPLCDIRFAFLEVEAPFAVSVVRLSPDFLSLGQAKWGRAKEAWRECLSMDCWPGYGDMEAVPPGWAMAQEMALPSPGEGIPDWLTE